MAAVDLSEFHKLSKPKRKPCPLASVLSELNGDDRAALKAALETDRSAITSTAIEKWLAARGHKVNMQTIGVHRRGVCACDG
jgi:hypothetical protein